MSNKTKDPTSSKSSLFWRITKVLVVFLVTFLLLFLLSIIALDQYLKSNQAKILDQIALLNDGSISFQKAEISLYKNFPSATILLRDVQVKDARFSEHGIPFLEAKEVQLGLSLKKIREQAIKINRVQFINASIQLYTDASGRSLIEQLKPTKSALSGENGWLREFQINANPLVVSFKNTWIRLINLAKKTSIKARADQLVASLEFNQTGLDANLDFSLLMQEMAFNTDKGYWLKGARLNGKPKVTLQNGLLTFTPFPLQINEEQFSFSGTFDTQKEQLSKLVLVNEKTRYDRIFPLLPKRLQEQVAPYQIQRPFASTTEITGFFRRGEHPIVDIDFRMKNNQLEIFHVDLHDVDLNGRFVNRLFDDERAFAEERKRIRLEVEQLRARYNNLTIQTQNALITSTPQTGPQLLTNLEVKGPAMAVSDWLSNDQFIFSQGQFKLNAQVQGPINQYEQLVINSDATLQLADILVSYLSADASFPFQQINLRKESGDAHFRLTSSSLVEGQFFQLSGFLENIPALLLELKASGVRSEAALEASNIAWTDFIDWFGKKGHLSLGKDKSPRETKQSMKQTISGIQERFHPRLSLSIDTMDYYNLLELRNFFTNIHFEGEDQIVLEKTKFDYDQGSVAFRARLDISDSLRTPFEFELETRNLNLKKLLPPLRHFNIQLLANLERLPEDLNLRIKHRGIIDDAKGLIPNTSSGEIYFDIENGKFLKGNITFKPDSELKKDSVNNKTFTKARIQLEGTPDVFNDFLKTEQFFFSQGRFYLDLDYLDDPANLEEILNQGKARLKIRNSNVFYQPAEVNFPLTKIDLFIDKDTADFDFFLRSDTLQQQINLRGTIQNLSELVVGNTGKSIRTTVDVNSPKLIWNQFIYLFAPEIDTNKKQDLDAIKKTVSGIFGTFDPALTAQTDTFIFTDKFIATDFHTGIFMTEKGELVLERTTFNFHDGSVGMDGRFDFGAPGPVPFNADFSTRDLNVEKLLYSLDYLSLPSLKSIEQLSGRITMDFHFSGKIASDGKSLIPSATRGYLDFELRDVLLKGMAPLDNLAAKIRMKKRFAELRFAPIENTLRIEGKQIQIPQMEVQSNAINLFLEGTLSYGDKTNIWISLPLDNLTKTDRSLVPPKRGYAATKHKVYIEVTSDEEGANQFKFRLSKRKFYKQRGIIERYRKDKRRWRQERKRKRNSN